MNNKYMAASIAQMQSVERTEAKEAALESERIQAMDFANRANSSLKRTSAFKRKSVRFTANSQSNTAVSADVFSNSAKNWPKATKDQPPEPNYHTAEPELLMPVRYSPPSGSESGSEYSTLSDDSWSSVKHSVALIEAQYALPENHADHATKTTDLTVNTEAYRGHTRNTSSMSRRGEIYFTPTDYTRSQIFLSSPVGSPELPLQQSEPEEECLTPKASMSRPPSAIFIGSDSRSRKEGSKEKLNITEAQLDQLVQGLAKSKLIQRHVRKQWWDDADIPVDDPVFAVSSVSTPAPKSVSTIYSQPNENFLRDDLETRPTDPPPNHPYATRPLPARPTSFGGIALLDSKIHGSPVRYITKDYRQGSKVLAVGSCTFLNVAYGTDVECTLRIEPPSPFNKSSKVFLQAVNQAVDRKTSKRAYLLLADVDVTALFAKAALTELAEATGKAFDDISIQIPLAKTPEESSIDWCALADEMQATADTAIIIENAVKNFANLDSETCAMRTLALMSELERIKDQHMEFLIVVPTSFHSNGMPSNMKMPWISQRLYNDWYGAKDGPGFTQTARDFQQSIVADVAKRAVAKEKFTVNIAWDKIEQVVHCVPLENREHGEGVAWVCFIRGEFDLQS